jgi:arylsulfatase A-like enzyme
VANSFAQSCDLMPTILDFAQIPAPASVQGMSLLPAIREPQSVLRQFAIAGNHKSSESIRDGEWSYYRWPGQASGKTGPELFRLADDPGEMNNIIERNRDVAKELDARLTSFLQTLR